MAYNFKQQLPYIAILCLISWAYLYVFAGPYIWLQAIIVVPILVGALWAYKIFAVPDEKFTILNTLKKHGFYIIWCGGICCLSYYYQNTTISLTYILLIYILIILSVVMLEHSLYE
jgi:hypothetical protein